jgi:UDP-N-acetylmuramate: L-alanyl-gamma-D-glutamyl-meso-diaminopimelate ligase
MELAVAQHIHIVGICGTFMGGVALLARQLGCQVSGSDANVYPPMSLQLIDAGIVLTEGFSAENLEPRPDLVVMGNALSRGNPEVEAVLDLGLPYVSGPHWLGENVLAGRWVIAVSGTHGKTSTTSMLAWILECAGMEPGFLVGGVPANFGQSACLGRSDFFVVEADEYDTAFFDKRSKFVHYKPRTLVMANLEYDHADIFPDLAAIETQFHHLIRCVPSEGLIIHGDAPAIERVFSRGVWTPRQSFGSQTNNSWSVRALSAAGEQFEVSSPAGAVEVINWSLIGAHNLLNACAAIAASHHAGVPLAIAARALESFAGVKRRLELRGTPAGVAVYDDFAHHPTAIALTLEAMRQRVGADSGRLLAVIEPRSATMKSGHHQATLVAATADADEVFWYEPPGLSWPLGELVAERAGQSVWQQTDKLIDAIAATARSGDVVVIMSNGGFGGIHEKLLQRLGTPANSS